MNMVPLNKHSCTHYLGKFGINDIDKTVRLMMDVSLDDIDTSTPEMVNEYLSQLVVSGLVTTLEALYIYGVDLVNSVDKVGRTLMMIAAMERDFNIASFLFQIGATTQAKDISGDTVYDIVIEENDMEMLKFMTGRKKSKPGSKLVNVDMSHGEDNIVVSGDYFKHDHRDNYSYVHIDRMSLNGNNVEYGCKTWWKVNRAVTNTVFELTKSRRSTKKLNSFHKKENDLMIKYLDQLHMI